MKFDPSTYGSMLAAILATDGGGQRLMPLVSGRCSPTGALTKIKTAPAELLFPNSRAPKAALSGLYIYFSCFDEAHEVAQSVDSPDGSYWHGILHRQEPDSANARYWFRRVESHPIFPDLADAAAAIARRLPGVSVAIPRPWNPSQFVEICERARQQPSSQLEQMALEIQLAEWQLLFDYCACVGSVVI